MREPGPYETHDKKPAPCLTCQYREKCRDEELACTTFSYFTRGRGLPPKVHRNKPNRLTFERLFL